MGTPHFTRSAVIALDGTLSAAVDLGDHRIVGICTPAAWTAAGISLLFCDTETGTFLDASIVGGLLAIVAVADQHVTLDPATLPRLRWVKVRSGTKAVPVQQAAERTLTLVCA